MLLKYRVVFAEGRGPSWKIEDAINRKWTMQMEDVKSYAEKNLKRQGV